MSKHALLVLWMTIGFVGHAASAQPIDWEEVSTAPRWSYSQDGATITLITGGDFFVYNGGPNGTDVAFPIAPEDSFSPFRIDFDSTVVEVRMDIGDFANDDDFLFLRAFDSNDVLIDEDMDFLAAPIVGMLPLSVSGSDIAYVIAGATGVDGSSVGIDNIGWLVPAIPGDVDGDGLVDIDDFLAVLAAWGPCVDCFNCPADLEGDCTVDVKDFLTVLAYWTS